MGKVGMIFIPYIICLFGYENITYSEKLKTSGMTQEADAAKGKTSKNGNYTTN